MKCPLLRFAARPGASPSVWRVWIEIITWTLDKEMIDRVTLRVEGVD